MSAPYEPCEAKDYYRLALAIASGLGMRPLIVHCHVGLGRLYARAGKREPPQELEKAEAEVGRG